MIRRAMLVLALIAAAVGLIPAAAVASSSRTPVGRLGTVSQDTFTHRLTVIGWAYVPARTSASIVVNVFVDGTYAGRITADDPSVGMDKALGISGRHDFRLSRSWTRTAGKVSVRSTGLSAKNPAVTLASASVTHLRPTPGERILAVAKRYVGTARYVEGGASPSGFDCSGYTRYAYARAKVATLPHNTEQQRRMKGMRHISKSAARPGDLVFYMSGGRSYHVAIYAGHDMQYAAATPRDGVRYQKVWSSAVQFGTDWH
jgi:cell wall-associated NlpC family hydrolase